MLASTLFVFLSFLGALVVAQNTPSVVCIAGQCVQGFTNLTLGTTLSASGSTANLHLLPGQYTESTNPQLLHSLLTSSSSTISSSAGFPNGSSVSLPLSIQLQPGLAFYSSANYSGVVNYVPLPTSANASNVFLSYNFRAALAVPHAQLVVCAPLRALAPVFLVFKVPLVKLARPASSDRIAEHVPPIVRRATME
ncbi:hypothetical protein ACEPAG_6783 [Sanghuangporus baumii]